MLKYLLIGMGLALLLGCRPQAETPPTSTPAAPLGQDASFDVPQPERGNSSDEEYVWNQLLAKDAIRPIYEAEVEFASADDAPYEDDELVIGVEINGEAKAYAVGPLNSREMVNDTIGGTPVLVTW